MRYKVFQNHYFGYGVVKDGVFKLSVSEVLSDTESTFTAIFESLVLGSKAGIDGKTLYDVFSSSGVSSPLFKNCAKLIMDRKFENT